MLFSDLVTLAEWLPLMLVFFVFRQSDIGWMASTNVFWVFFFRPSDVGWMASTNGFFSCFQTKSRWLNGYHYGNIYCQDVWECIIVLCGFVFYLAHCLELLTGKVRIKSQRDWSSLFSPCFAENNWAQHLLRPALWVSDCCVMPNDRVFSYIMTKKS